MRYAFIIIIFFVLYSCTPQEKDSQYTIAFSQCTMNAEWRKAMYEEMQREASFYEGINLIFRNAKDNSQTQVKQIEELINTDIDLLIVSPNEAKPITDVVEKAHQKNIPVIVLDRKVNTQKYTAYLGGNNTMIGKLAGKYVVDLLQGKGNILEVWGSKGSSPAQNRHKGFKEVIAKYPDIKIIAEIEGNWYKKTTKTGLERITDSLRKIDLVYAHNDVMADGVREFFKENNIQKMPYLIGVDALGFEGGGIDLVNQTKLTASMLYPTGGKESIQLALKILNKEKFEKENILQTTLIDSNNVQTMKFQTELIIEQQKDIDKQQQKISTQIDKYEKQGLILYAMIGGLLVISLLGIWLFYLLLARKKMNKKLFQQKEVIEDKSIKLQESIEELETLNEELFQNSEEMRAQNDVIDKQNMHLTQYKTQVQSSIQAAYNIQEAMLPDVKEMKEILPNHFALYMPRDIVSGDFYWVEEVNDTRFVISSDCTGHGIPGAFMSMIGISLLNRIILQNKETDPAKILQKLNKHIRFALNQEAKLDNNGMDISILKIQKQGNLRTITFSGAKGRIFYALEGDSELTELRGNRKSIGGYRSSEMLTFDNKLIETEKEVLIYLGSDGFPDQNDVKRRKIGSSKLKSLLEDYMHYPLEEQKSKIQEFLTQHMEGTVQRDDILWMGLKV